MEKGRHFETITPPIATNAASDIIEVLDVFWYGCPVCKEFEPLMTYWGGQVKGDLVMRRLPAIWNPVMRTQAQLYFTAVELNIVSQVHPAAFSYVQEEKKPLNTQEQVSDFFGVLGVAKEDFEKAWYSDNVSSALEAAERDTTAAGINRLPALVVNGRYQVVRNEGVPELERVIITANQLIKVLRDERRTD